MRPLNPEVCFFFIQFFFSYFILFIDMLIDSEVHQFLIDLESYHIAHMAWLVFVPRLND